MELRVALRPSQWERLHYCKNVTSAYSRVPSFTSSATTGIRGRMPQNTVPIFCCKVSRTFISLCSR